jgi:hypothetical protein
MARADADAASQYHDGNERDIEHKQNEPVTSSEALRQDSHIDPDAVHVLPGTGGPDDVGDIETNGFEYHPHG